MRKIVSLLLAIFLLFLAIQKSVAVQNIVWRESSEGLYGGVVTSIETETMDKNIYYAGTIRGGVFVSKDSGTKWEASNKGLKNLYIRSLLSLPGLVLAGTEDFIYKSNDLGQNWKKVSENIINITVNTIVSGKNNDSMSSYGKLFAGTNQGLYESIDSGENWSKVSINMSINVLSIVINHAFPNIIFMSCKDKLLLKSLDYGVNWENITTSENLLDIQNLLIDKNNSNILYAGTENGVLLSIDAGKNWSSISSGLSNLYISSLIQDDENSDIYASTYGGVFKFNKDNNSWSKVGQTIFNENILSLKIVKYLNKKIIVGTNGGGLYEYDFGMDSWKSINTGLKNTHIKTLKCFGSGDRLIAAVWGNGIFKSTDLGNSWSSQNEGLTNPLILCVESNGSNMLLAGTFNSGIFVSYNYGDKWEKLIAPTLINWYIYSIAFDPKNPKTIYVGTSDGIHRSFDDGKTWSKIFPLDPDIKIAEIVDIKFDSTHIYAATQGNGVYISKDDGDTWIESNSGLGNLNIQSIQIDPFFVNTVYVSTFGSGVYKSVDSGSSWNQANEGLANLFVYNILVDPNLKNKIYASTETGIFNSENGGKSWDNISEGVKDISIRQICFNQADTRLYAGSFGNGIYKSYKILSTPNPELPANGSKIITNKPLLKWTEAGETDLPYTYRVNISEDENFTNIIYDKGEILSNQFIVPENILTKSKKYYWKVRTETSVGNSEWSKVYNFYTVTQIILRVNDPMMKVDGANKEIDPGRKTTPIIKNSRTFLPIRALVEELGGNVEWDVTSRKITIILNNTKIELYIDNNMGIVNGNKIQIDNTNPKIVPFISNGRTMLPIRFITENLGAEISWDGKTQTITIIYPLIK